MHKTLSRQVAHHIGKTAPVSPEWYALLAAVSTTYDDFDKDRALVERSLTISSGESKELISLLRATLDSITEGILVVDSEDRIVNHNRRFLEIWDVSRETVTVEHGEKLRASTLEKVLDPEKFRGEIEELRAHPERETDDILTLKNRKTIERRSKPQMVGKKSVGRVWSFRDITKRVATEKDLKARITELERLNTIMVDRELKMIELKKKMKACEEESTSGLPHGSVEQAKETFTKVYEK